MPKTPTEAALFGGAKRGDVVAWEILCRRIYPKLRGYLSRKIHPGEIDDIIGETMTRAVAGIRKVEIGETEFDGWVFGIARHVVADHHRRAARKSKIPIGGVHLMGDAPGPVGEDADIATDQEMVRRCFTRLSPRDREILELRVIAGLSVEETARALGRRPGAVRTGHSRAIERLRTLMDGHRD